ncbi:MAG: cytochrome c oxidase subunit 3 [bacterium]
MSEASHEGGHYTSLGVDSRKLGMWIFLASECLLFGTLIFTFLLYRNKGLEGPTPLQILDIPVTTISTFVLLMSSFSIVLALHGIQTGNIKAFRRWILTTAIGGTVFLGFQTYEFTVFVEEGLGLTTSVFGSSFFMLTGTHGFHVAIGVIWMLALFFSSLRGGLTVDGALKVDTMALYWHFVDVIWIVIFTVVYLFAVV